MSNQTKDIKKSNFVAQETVEDDATFDFVINNTNRKITKANLVAEFGTTGSLEQQGDVSGTPVLNKSGTTNYIRNIEDGPGVKASVSAQGGVQVEHDLSFDSTGTALSGNPTDQTVIFRSLLPGAGVSIATVGDAIQIAATGITVAANVVIVNTMSDFPTASGGVITLADNTAYLVSAHLTTANRFVLGNNTIVYGADSTVSSITYTGAGVMFTGSYDSKLTQLKLSCTAGTLLSLTGSGAETFQLINLTVANCNIIGTITDFNAVQITDVAFDNIISDGLSFAGTFAVVVGSRNLFVVNGGTGVDLGTAVFNAGWSMTLSFASLAAGAYFLDGAAASANLGASALGTLTTTMFSGSGTPLNTISVNDLRWQFFGNNAIPDTGQELRVRVTNNSGSSISNGTVVYIDGSASGIPTIQLAQPDEYDKSRIIGVTTETIANGANGYVTKFGTISDLNTSSFSDGDTVYLDDNGQLTTTEPMKGDFKILVGVITDSDATAGQLFVNPSMSSLTVEVTDTNGFPDAQRTGTTIAIVDSTRTFSITPTGSEFYYYQNGAKYIKSAADSVVFADTEGLWIFYYDGSTLTALNSPTTPQIETIVKEKTIVSAAYWDATNSKTVYFGDERHGISMSPDTHAYLHVTEGTRFLSGLALTLTSEGNGDLDESLETSSAIGYVADEDLQTTISAKAINEQIPIFYKSGASANWRKQFISDSWSASTVYSAGDKILAVTGNAAARGLIFQCTVGGTSGGTEPVWQDASGAVDADGGDPCGATTTDNTVTWVCVGSAYSRLINFVGSNYYPAYNQYTGGAWQQTEVASNSYLLAHYFATNDVNEPLVIIQGEETYSTITGARVGANEEINNLTSGAMPFAEFVPIASVIFQVNSGYDNFAKARVRASDLGADYVDWRFQELTPGSGVTSHSNLSGLTEDDHTQYALLAGRSTGQTLIGGTDASDDLTLQSTSNATRGQIVLNDDLQMPDNSAILLSGETAIDFNLNGAVELYYDNAKKFETLSNGVRVESIAGANAYINGNGTASANGGYLHLQAPNAGLSDYASTRLTHNITDAGNTETAFIIQAASSAGAYQYNILKHDYASNILTLSPGGETAITATKDGAVELYYDAVKRLETTSVGLRVSTEAGIQSAITIDGDHTGNSSVLTLRDAGTLNYWQHAMKGSDHPTAADDFSIIYNGLPWMRFDVSADKIFITPNNETAITATKDGAVELYYDAVKKFETTNTGVKAKIDNTNHASTATLTADDVSGGIINNYGQAAANTQTLPAAAAGLHGRVVIGTAGAGAFNLKAGASDKIYLDGVALDDGDKATLATPAVGDTFKFFSFQTGASAYDWVVVSEVGTLTDGGA